MEGSVDGLVANFERERLDPARFTHKDHVKVAVDLLRERAFPVAYATMSRGLLAIAHSAGRPDRYNETITGAFLSVIAERLLTRPVTSFEEFESANPDLMSRDFLRAIYPSERL